MRAYDLPNYDNWLNSNNPYDLADEEQRKRDWLLDYIKTMDTEEEIQDYLSEIGEDDPREE